MKRRANTEGMLKAEFVYQLTVGSKITLPLEVRETAKVADVIPEIIQWLRASHPDFSQDICLSQGHTIIGEDITFHSEHDLGKPLEYVVHVLPLGNFKSVMLTSQTKNSKEEEHLVIVPEKCTVNEFRGQVAKVLQQPDGKLRLQCRKGRADPRGSEESSDFFQNPWKTFSYQSSTIQIWKEELLTDCPHEVKHLRVEIDSNKIRRTVTVSVMDNTHTRHTKNDHRLQLFKEDSFAVIQKQIGAIYAVDFRLVQLTDKSGKSIHLHEDPDFKRGRRRTNKIDATIWSKGKVVKIRHDDDDEYVCVLKDPEQITVKQVRRTIERFHRKPNDTFKVEVGASFPREDSFVSNILTDSCQELMLHRNVRRHSERKRPGPPEATTVTKKRAVQENKAGAPSSNVPSKANTQVVAALREVEIITVDEDSHTDSDSSEEDDSDVQRAGENRGREAHRQEQSKARCTKSTVAEVHCSRSPPHQQSIEVGWSRASNNLLAPRLREVTNLPIARQSIHEQVDEDFCADVLRETRTLQRGRKIMAHMEKVAAINPAFADDPSVSHFLSAQQHQGMTAPPALEEPPGVIKDAMLREIAERLGNDWASLCISLDVPADEISRIQHDVRLLHDQAFEGLRRWKKIKGREATPAVLKKALRKKALNSLADMM